jgi:hypothetical protein
VLCSENQWRASCSPHGHGLHQRLLAIRAEIGLPPCGGDSGIQVCCIRSSVDVVVTQVGCRTVVERCGSLRAKVKESSRATASATSLHAHIAPKSPVASGRPRCCHYVKKRRRRRRRSRRRTSRGRIVDWDGRRRRGFPCMPGVSPLTESVEQRARAPAHGMDGARDIRGPTTKCEREERTYGGPPEK